MTLEDRLKKMMFDMGLFPAQVEKIMQAVKADPANELMKDRWGDPDDEVFVKIGWMSVQDHAEAWMARECPKHWARPMFKR